MHYTKYFVSFCGTLAFSHALSLPQATPLPQKRGFGNLTLHAETFPNTTLKDAGNSSLSGGQFNMKLDPMGGTITMNVGPLSAFTQTTTSLATPTGTGYVIYPTNYHELQEIPADGIRVVFYEQTQQDLLTKFKTACTPDDVSEAECIEGLGEVLHEQAPDLQKRFLIVLPVLAVILAVEALQLAIYLKLVLDSGPDYKKVPMIHYESSVLASAAAVSTATSASVIVVESTTGDKQAITISTTELTSFNPSPTASAFSGGTGFLTSDSSNHFVFNIQSTDMAALESAKTAMATPTGSCTYGTSRLIERDESVEEEITCLANTLMDNSEGLMNPNGLMSIFRTQVVEVAEHIVPDFFPNFQDIRVAGAFGLFLVAADVLIPRLFPGLGQAAWHMAGFIAFALTMLPLATNSQGKIQQASGVTQIVLQVTKGKSSSDSESICPPTDQPYDCDSIFCVGNADNVCTGIWSENCPCTKCPSAEDMPSCDDCNSPSNANNTQGKCTTVTPGCSCYIDTMQNSSLIDSGLSLLISNSLASWTSGTSFPYMEGVTCRPDNFWYSICQYPNTDSGFAFGANKDLESCLASFQTTADQTNFDYNHLPNPTMPTDYLMGPQSLNVTMICPTNKATVDFIRNVAYAPGCISPNAGGKVNILDPIGDNSIKGLDILRGTYYGCMNFIASVDPAANTINMLPGSASKGYKASTYPAANNLYPGASNSGTGGWNQVGCLIYEVIPSKNRPRIAVNQGSSNVWFQGANWKNYVADWPTLAKTYYDDGALYCQPPSWLRSSSGSITGCEAFPCSLGSAASLASIKRFVQI